MRAVANRRINFGSFGTTTPISRSFGYDRGLPIDRYYIEKFLAEHSRDICGRALEIGDASYCNRFGAGRVTRQEVLHIHRDAPGATLIGDLSMPGILPEASLDAIVLTQTLHLIYDMTAAVAELHRGLKPGGVALVTVPGVSQIASDVWGATWFWSLTEISAHRLFEEEFGAGNVTTTTTGNVYAATAFLQGLAVQDVEQAKLDVVDTLYPLIVTVRAVRSA
jgi:hypothetical protein